MKRPDVRILIIIIVLALLAGGAYLLNSKPALSPAPSGTPTPSAVVSPTVNPTPKASNPAAGNWHTDDFTVAFTGDVPPLPTLKAIRTARHPEDGYDRIAFDFDSAQSPGYRVRYVTQVVKDGSGQPVTLTGPAYLQIVFDPAAAHTDAGVTTITPAPTNPVPVNYSELKSYVMNGDFEGQVSVALGLAAKTGFRSSVARTGNLWTVYIDVRQP